MDKKIQFLLEHCFKGKIREHSYYISDFTDNSGREIISIAKSIENYIDVNSVISKVKKECFDKYFKIENFKDKRVLAFLIKQLSDFENFDYGFTKNQKSYDNMYCLKYKGEDLRLHNWREITGYESYNNYAYVFTESVLFYFGYEKSKKDLQDVGINPVGGGSVANYIRHGIYDFKPHIAELVSFLNSFEKTEERRQKIK
jgi:hypothetical protein